MVRTAPDVAIAKLIKNSWNGASGLPSAIDTINMGFEETGMSEVLLHTSLVEHEHVMPQVAVVFGWEMDVEREEAVLEEIMVRVFVWVPRDYDGQNPGTLKMWKGRMREEVKRIVRAQVGEAAPGSAEYDLLRNRVDVRNADNFKDGWYADELVLRLQAFVLRA